MGAGYEVFDVNEDSPLIHRAVLRSTKKLLRDRPGGVDITEIGVAAWNSLTPGEMADALPALLSSYVQVVHAEEHELGVTREAADPTHTYLRESDLADLWCYASSRQNAQGEVPADHAALVNVLSELELLQHRLAMAAGPAADKGGAA